MTPARSFCPGLLAVLLLGMAPHPSALAASAANLPEAGKPLPAWTEGLLDIHHINTGRGDATFFILPDGTNLLVDTSGKTVEKPPFSLPTRPDSTRPPGEWVARYIRNLLPGAARRIDYVLLSHFHGDHMGAITDESPMARQGGYRLSGVTEIAEHLHIARIIDRGWPDYAYPAPLNSRTIRNYRSFQKWQAENRGLVVERFRPGRNDQITLLRKPGAYPRFEVRNLMANGVLWTGHGTETRSLFPPVASLPPQDLPIENKLSIAFRLSYGKFDYFTGGDLSASGDDMLSPVEAWKNVELPVAQVTGPVDAMKANHHGSWDANSAGFLGHCARVSSSSPRVPKVILQSTALRACDPKPPGLAHGTFS